MKELADDSTRSRNAHPLRVLGPNGVDRSWPLFDAAGSRALEAAAAAPLPPHTLMQRAGLAVARVARAVVPFARRVRVVAGPGNNGGDGFEAAFHLRHWDADVRVLFEGDRTRLPADAQASLARAVAAGVPIDTDPAAHASWAALDDDDLLIDGLLGRGLTRAPEGRIAAAIDALRASRAPVLAIDLPSGLPGDTGQPAHESACVTARWTIALLALAPGHFTAAGRDAVGDLWFDDLQVDVGAATPVARLAATSDLARLHSARRHAQHKGSFGDLWVCGGATSMSGAALLAARAGLQAGAGRVYLSLLDEAAARVDALHAELMFAPIEALLSGNSDALSRATVVAGCGGGDAIRTRLPALLARAGRLVLDADALNAIAADEALAMQLRARAARGQASVLTPHPLEAARLLGSDAQRVQADRLAAARQLCDRFGACVVLKGSGSIVAAPGCVPSINPTGNAALATPGSGDVLAGWLGGRWCAQAGNDEAALAFDTARAAVYQHGLAAQRAHPDARVLPAGRLIEALAALD